VAGYRDRQAALVLHPRRWRADDLCRWNEWKDKATVEVLKSCTMLITEPNDFVAEVHDRMPVVLESKDFVST
jgi:SOS response associated peptidase (SRAP)